MNRWTTTITTAAALALCAGTAGAGSAPTVRCVNRVDPACQTTHGTIQAAVTASTAGDIVLVGAGTYNEAVLVDRTLKLFGARNGIDARRRPDFPFLESIVDGTGTGASSIIVQASDVVIDGFTVQGGVEGNATGIDLKGSGGGGSFIPAHRARVVNNIMQNNSVGLSLNSEGFGPVTNVVIERNLFRNNNAGVPAVAGDGIFTSACQHVLINENKFTGHLRLGIGINNSTNVTITRNESDGDARFVVYTGTTDSELSDNRVRNLITSGLFANTRAAGISVRNGNSRLAITSNIVGMAQQGSVIRGIQFGAQGALEAVNTEITVANNRFHNLTLHGMVAETSMLTNSHFIGNFSVANGDTGILINSGSTGNVFTENRSRSNVSDCVDLSTGSGTAGTASTWFDNTGATDSPTAICNAPRLSIACTPDNFTAGPEFFVRTAQCTLTSLGGAFVGFVGLACDGEPHPLDIGCIMSSPFVSVPAGGSATVQLSLGAAQMPPGVYSVHALAVTVGIQESQDLRLTITP